MTGEGSFLWDAATSSTTQLPTAPNTVVQLATVPQQPHLLLGGCMHGRVVVWNWHTKQLLACPPCARPLGPMCTLPRPDVHPDALCAVMVAGDGGLQVLAVPAQGPLLPVEKSAAAAVQVACCAGRCVAMMADGSLLLWRAGRDGCTVDVCVEGLVSCGEWLVAWGEVGCLVLHHDAL